MDVMKAATVQPPMGGPLYAHNGAAPSPFHHPHLQLLQPTLLHGHHPLAHHEALPVPSAPSLPPGMYTPSPYMAPTGAPIPMDMTKGM